MRSTCTEAYHSVTITSTKTLVIVEEPRVSTTSPIDVDKSPRKKRVRTHVTWECPVCLEELGDSPGLVPCIIISCKPAPHSICIDCHDKLLRNTCPLCPKCRQPITELVPMFDLIPRDDDVALSKANSNFGSSSLQNTRKADTQSSMLKISNEHSALVNKRLDLVVAAVLKTMDSILALPYGNSRYFWWEKVRAWDAKNVSVSNRGKAARSARLRKLETIAQELQSHLDDIFGDSDVIVIMSSDQQDNGKLTYLRYSVSRRRPRNLLIQSTAAALLNK